jgi:hypothetical protein
VSRTTKKTTAHWRPAPRQWLNPDLLPSPKLRRRIRIRIFYNLALFRRKFTFRPLDDVNSTLDPGSRCQLYLRTGHGSEKLAVSRLANKSLTSKLTSVGARAITHMYSHT